MQLGDNHESVPVRGGIRNRNLTWPAKFTLSWQSDFGIGIMDGAVSIQIPDAQGVAKLCRRQITAATVIATPV